MGNTVIENPVINSPFEVPKRHFRFDDEGITDTIEPQRRRSEYFVPVAGLRKRGKQFRLEGEWTEDRVEENKLVNRIRPIIDQWRRGGHQGVTKTTRRLLEYWTDPDRERRLFFCQIEALETVIYIAEAATKFGDAWIANTLRDENEGANPGLYRIACKMATGTGKTVVMAMMIAWQVLNNAANPRDRRFNDAFLIVTPGITIRDRLRVLLPSDPENYYRKHDIVPPMQRDDLQRARIVITNFHAFQRREMSDAGKLAKQILGDPEAFRETPDQMVRRVCRELGNKRNIIVINDEAHHCYQRKPTDAVEDELTGDERREAESREKQARVWLTGIRYVAEKLGVRAIYDLSATPFFLRGSGYSEGTLFPWTVSDFSLIDAIEAGIVKVPRVPVADNSMIGEVPKYRDLWLYIRDDLPKKGRGTEPVTGQPRLPAELQGALHSLYSNYEKHYRAWEAAPAGDGSSAPPVFIVVCNNTNVSKLVYDFIAGWEKPLSDGQTTVVPGELDIFRNDDDRGGWLPRPNTILVDSEELESGDAMSSDFKKIAVREIDEFKAEYRRRFPDRDVESLTDEDLLREVLNTVGKPGKLGEQIKCVVSVSMLSEGWDANTVTHILGIRAFGTQLLCEQVVGRGLRRRSYAVEDREVSVNGETVHFEGFPPQYAEVYGVPFSFIPSSGATGDSKPGPAPTRVRAIEARAEKCEITFPRVEGYKYDVGVDRLHYRFTEDSRMVLTTREVPTKVENEPIVGEGVIHRLDDLRQKREQEVAFLLGKLVLEKYFRLDPEDQASDDGQHHFLSDVQAWLFPQVLTLAREWIDQCLVCHDGTFPQLLLLIQNAHNAADRIYRAIADAEEGRRTLKPLLRPYDTIGSTKYVDFDTTRPVYLTAPEKCHISHVVADTGSWEQKMAQTLEEMDEVECYVKNHNLGFTIPYTVDGRERNYIPDFIAHVRRPDGALINLIVEVTGEKKEDKLAKTSTAKTLWVPAINNHGGFGRWEFLEITDPWNAVDEIREHTAPSPQ